MIGSTIRLKVPQSTLYNIFILSHIFNQVNPVIESQQ